MSLFGYGKYLQISTAPHVWLGKWPQLSTVTYSIYRLLSQLWGVTANYSKCYSSEDFTVSLIVSEFIGKFTSFAAVL